MIPPETKNISHYLFTKSVVVLNEELVLCIKQAHELSFYM